MRPRSQALAIAASIRLEGIHPDDLAEACEAVKSGARFFETAGLSMPANVTIRLVDEPAPSLVHEHEIAHAAVASGCRDRCATRAAHEYVAAIAQISVLPEESRSELLAGYRDLNGFEDESEITEIYYAINPRQIAVKSYKHFVHLSAPREFLGKLLAGR